MAGQVGRPRKHSPRRRGATAREEILDAASELFTRQGFATTSTHQIADAVGIRQASLYYHFPSKTEIFLTLLKSTIEPSVRLALDLQTSAEPAAMRLWAMVATEAHLLLASRWNVGRLYQLPVASSTEFNEYHAQRAELSAAFRVLAAELVGSEDPRLELPFQLAMAAIEMRDNTGTAPAAGKELPATAVTLADAALDVLHVELPEERVARTNQLLESFGA